MSAPGSKRSYRKLLVILAVLIAGGLVVWLSVRRLNSLAQASSAKEVVSAPLTVRAVLVRKGTIRSWVFGQGTARTVRREYLTFQSEGKVRFVKKGPGGRELREGDPVKGPAKGEDHGELLARLDDRNQVAEVNVAKAAMHDADVQVVVVQTEMERAEADLVRAKADLASAKTDHDLAKLQLKRHQDLLKANAVAQSEFDTAKATASNAAARVQAAEAGIRAAEVALKREKARITAAVAAKASALARFNQANVSLERTRLFAPIDGVIAYLNVKEGRLFSPTHISTDSEEAMLNSVPMVIIDPREYEIAIEVPEFDGLKIKPDQRAFILLGEDLTGASLNGMDEKTRQKLFSIQGKVFSVNPALNPGGRSVQIRIRTTLGAERLRDGMFVTCWIVGDEKSDAKILPYNALITRDKDMFAFVADAAGKKAEPRKIELGIFGLDGVEALSGVNEGERVITDGRYQLTSGAPIEILETAQTESREGGARHE